MRDVREWEGGHLWERVMGAMYIEPQNKLEEAILYSGWIHAGAGLGMGLVGQCMSCLEPPLSSHHT